MGITHYVYLKGETAVRVDLYFQKTTFYEPKTVSTEELISLAKIKPFNVLTLQSNNATTFS